LAAVGLLPITLVLLEIVSWFATNSWIKRVAA
jgi:hypothetical protein